MGRLEAERIEIGVEVSAAVGADQHQGVDGVARRLLDLGGRELDAGRLRARLDLVADAFSISPQSASSADTSSPRGRCGQFGSCHDGPCALLSTSAIVFQALEERLPLGVDRLRIAFVAGIGILDVVGVATVEERGAGKSGVGVLTGHARVLWLGLWVHPESAGPRGGVPAGLTLTLFMLHLRCHNDNS